MSVEIYLSNLLKILENEILEAVQTKENKLLAKYISESMNSIHLFLRNFNLIANTQQTDLFNVIFDYDTNLTNEIKLLINILKINRLAFDCLHDNFNFLSLLIDW